FGMGVMIGPILGPVLGGWLTDNFNWRWVFLITPTGRLTRNTQRQLKLSVSQPPSTGPRIGPIITPIPNIAMARGWFCGGLMSNITAWAIGTRKAPDTPWIARKATICGRSWAMAHSTEAAVKAITEPMNRKRRP